MTKTEFLPTTYTISTISSRKLIRIKKNISWLIQYQILQTNITGTVWQTVRRITNEIMGDKGLIRSLVVSVCFRGDFMPSLATNRQRKESFLPWWSLQDLPHRFTACYDLLRYDTWRWRMDATGYKPHQQLEGTECEITKRKLPKVDWWLLYSAICGQN